MGEKSDAATAGAVVRGEHAQDLAVERLDNFGGQDRLELFNVRVCMPQIAVKTLSSCGACLKRTGAGFSRQSRAGLTYCGCDGELKFAAAR
jgi:hypothetical protein